MHNPYQFLAAKMSLLVDNFGTIVGENLRQVSEMQEFILFKSGKWISVNSNSRLAFAGMVFHFVQNCVRTGNILIPIQVSIENQYHLSFDMVDCNE